MTVPAMIKQRLEQSDSEGTQVVVVVTFELLGGGAGPSGDLEWRLPLGAEDVYQTGAMFDVEFRPRPR